MTRKSISDSAVRSKKRGPASEATGANPIAEKLRPRHPQRLTMPSGEKLSFIPVLAVIERAADMGLMTSNTQHVGARLPIELLQQAKERTGIASTTELLEFALANVAVDDNFATAFAAARGQFDPDLDVGF